ncbi:electron transport complex subunit RsxE [Sporomusa acidovorans]|uniref:Na(+)-translocating ferredoxin:NAD(+) oxidoreductase complex subunit E n=1 Tax=Sporomusa acidovorans (strain ATCC 49682 / DSM 3132 / Mol) TaxID=1123286 RepID=A0ABZ3J0P2_SPOA4|nr:electron transport complex subunit RsxE [Sporomusa acidovorans]OZC22498.1 electron transport complex subunit RnfE [Sporomusa acidovorans DSM 3132]SDE73533.1 electron transport complex protein RnfE [Sporomusa acidovorans]
MNYWEIFKKGIFEMNPIFRLALSLCPALAVTSTVFNAFGMGMCVLVVITANNVVVSIIKKLVNPKVRVPVFITIIATIVTLIILTLEAYFPAVYRELGLYLELIVVFAIILARAEVFAMKNGVIPSFFDGLGMGAGFTVAMLFIGVVRELFGTGMLLGGTSLAFHVFPESYNGPMIMILAPGAFLAIGLMIGMFNVIGEYQDKQAAKAKAQAKASQQLAVQRSEAV